MDDFQTILISPFETVTTVMLHRPEKHNAMNSRMIQELTEAFSTLGNNHTVRVIVLRGEGPSFCAGADLSYMQEIAGNGSEANTEDALRLAQLFDTIYHCPKPVVTVLHGAVIGGANGLAAASDIVIAAVDSVFSFSEVRLGITPATISPYVIRRCGEAAARELMLSGRRFTAMEAQRYMLVNHIDSAEKPGDVLHNTLNQLLAGAPGALADCKRLISDITANPKSTTDLLTVTAERIAARRASEEGQEGMNAFFDKRKPYWFQKVKHEDH